MPDERDLAALRDDLAVLKHARAGHRRVRRRLNARRREAERTSVRIPLPVKVRLQERALQEGVSLSALITNAVADYIGWTAANQNLLKSRHDATIGDNTRSGRT